MLSLTPDSWAWRAGLLALPSYLALLVILGALEPGYSHLTMTMSILGGVGGMRGLTFNLGVAVTGMLVIAFAMGLHRRLPTGWATRAGTICLVLGGIGLIGAAIFHCNSGCTNVLKAPTIVGRTHIGMALASGLFTSIAPFFFWASMRRAFDWQSFALPTLAAGILANLPGGIFWITLATDMRLPAVEGLIQRMGFVFVLIWIFTAAVRLRCLSRSAS